MTAALETGMAKAREHGLSLVNVSNHEHTGRVGTYAETAAKDGMASFMCSGYVGGQSLMAVAPFGGTVRKLSTNPLVIAFPYNDEGPILLDFATTISAEGKLRVARAKGATLPDYWTITADGTPSNDPNTYYEGGSLLPIGGLHGGHKGVCPLIHGGPVRRRLGCRCDSRNAECAGHQRHNAVWVHSDTHRP